MLAAQCINEECLFILSIVSFLNLTIDKSYPYMDGYKGIDAGKKKLQVATEYYSNVMS